MSVCYSFALINRVTLCKDKLYNTDFIVRKTWVKCSVYWTLVTVRVTHLKSQLTNCTRPIGLQTTDWTIRDLNKHKLNLDCYQNKIMKDLIEDTIKIDRDSILKTIYLIRVARWCLTYYKFAICSSSLFSEVLRFDLVPIAIPGLVFS